MRPLPRSPRANRHWPAGLLLGLWGLIGAGSPALAATGADPSCAVPPYLWAQLDRLPHAAARVRDKQPLRVVFIGSGAMAGMGTSSVEAAFPARFADAVSRRLPHLDVTLHNLSKRRQTLAEAVALIHDRVGAAGPDLLVWQIGLREIAANIADARFDQYLSDGIEAARRFGRTDLLLMDIPFYPGQALLMADDDYREAIEHRALLDDVPLFRTYALMKHWHEQGAFGIEPGPAGTRERQAAIADQTHKCLGSLLASHLERAVQAR